MTVWGVVVAGGSGTRFGAPKQHATVAGATLLEHAVAATQRSCDHVVVVLDDPAAWQRPQASPNDLDDDVAAVVEGGATRAASVRAGLAAIADAGGPGADRPDELSDDVVHDDARADDPDIILVHDAARPAASDALFVSVIDAVRAGADGAVPATAVADTIKRIDGTQVVETLDRSSLVAVQTPQAFRAEALRDAHRDAEDATDDAALVERRGAHVVVVAGDPRNVKVTTPADVALVERTLAEQVGLDQG